MRPDGEGPGLGGGGGDDRGLSSADLTAGITGGAAPFLSLSPALVTHLGATGGALAERARLDLQMLRPDLGAAFEHMAWPQGTAGEVRGALERAGTDVRSLERLGCIEPTPGHRVVGRSGALVRLNALLMIDLSEVSDDELCSAVEALRGQGLGFRRVIVVALAPGGSESVRTRVDALHDRWGASGGSAPLDAFFIGQGGAGRPTFQPESLHAAAAEVLLCWMLPHPPEAHPLQVASLMGESVACAGVALFSITVPRAALEEKLAARLAQRVLELHLLPSARSRDPVGHASSNDALEGLRPVAVLSEALECTRHHHLTGTVDEGVLRARLDFRKHLLKVLQSDPAAWPNHLEELEAKAQVVASSDMVGDIEAIGHEVSASCHERVTQNVAGLVTEIGHRGLGKLRALAGGLELRADELEGVEAAACPSGASLARLRKQVRARLRAQPDASGYLLRHALLAVIALAFALSVDLSGLGMPPWLAWAGGGAILLLQALVAAVRMSGEERRVEEAVSAYQNAVETSLVHPVAQGLASQLRAVGHAVRGDAKLLRDKIESMEGVLESVRSGRAHLAEQEFTRTELTAPVCRASDIDPLLESMQPVPEDLADQLARQVTEEGEPFLLEAGEDEVMTSLDRMARQHLEARDPPRRLRDFADRLDDTWRRTRSKELQRDAAQATQLLLPIAPPGNLLQAPLWVLRPASLGSWESELEALWKPDGKSVLTWAERLTVLRVVHPISLPGR